MRCSEEGTIMGKATSGQEGGLQGKVAVVTDAAREEENAIGIDICASVYPRSGVKPSNPEDLKETGKLVNDACGR